MADEKTTKTFASITQSLVSPTFVGEVTFASGPTQTTVGSAGSATALPSEPTGYLRIKISGTEVVVPFYDQA